MNSNKKFRHISILGAGKIGQALAQLWLRAGHTVCLGMRSPEKLVGMVETFGSQLTAKSIKEAASEGEVVLLATPYSAVNELTTLVSDELVGKIVLDATNPVSFSPEGRIISTLNSEYTAGSYMAKLLPKSTIIRAFSHVMDELLVSRGTSQAGTWAIAMAGDDSTAKLLVAELIRDTGFVPVDIGTLVQSAPLDPGGVLFPHMFSEADMHAALMKK